MKKSIGIDLGTTNSVSAFKDLAVKILRNKENEELTRSCVGFRKGEILVGRTAYQLLTADPINTILSIKRLMGATLTDNMVQQMIDSSYYKYGIASLSTGTNESVAVILSGKQYTPEQISSEILKKLKADSEERLGDEVTHAVITVPAYFTERQKNATRIAAQLAGLKVQKLLAEPTAAAIAYGVDNLKAGESKTVLIYDFGGGTFDLSILNIVDGQYMEAGTGGDRWLGGDDIDKKLQSVVLKKVSEQYKLTDLESLISNLAPKKKINFEGLLRFKCEEAKIELSSSKTAPIFIDNILEDENGDMIDIDINITRDEFDEIVKPFVSRSIELIEQLLKEVGYDITMIDNILLVGGSSCIPLVKKMLTDKYGSNKIRTSEKPMLAIAEGAAILSHRLGDEYEAAEDGENVIGDIISCSTNHNYYIEVVEGEEKKKKRIIEKQTPLPIETSKTFKTTTNNQKIAKVSIFADVESGNFEQQLLGYYLIDENLPIQSELVFEFFIDLNENFSVKVYPKGMKNKSKSIVLGRGYADHKALEAIDELIDKAVSEFRTINGEEDFMSFITDKINEIDKIGIKNITENKWHELYYLTTEKFEEIKKSEPKVSNFDRILNRSKILLIEFGELLDSNDRATMINIIKELESSDNDVLLVEKLEKLTDRYGLLNAALQIESFAERIYNIPTPAIGETNTKSDVTKLNQLSNEIKTSIKMKQIDRARTMMDEAYSVINKYQGKL